MLGVVQALALWMTPMLWTTMLLGVAILTVTGLDDPYGRMGVKTFISPSVIPLSKGRLEYCEVYNYSLDVSLHGLLNVVPRGMILLLAGRVDLLLRGICHVSFSGWLCRFRC